MTRIIGELAEIGTNYDVLFCDLWGCLHNGRAPYPAAVTALRDFREGGGQVCLMTNAPRPSTMVIAHLDRLGVPRDIWDCVVSSGDASQDAMLAGAVGHRVWHLGPEKDDEFFISLPQEWTDPPRIERVPLSEAEGIVCTGLFDDMTEVPEDYRARLMLAKQRDLPMLCANPDIVVDYGDMRIYCAGALAALYEEMGGRTIYGGKPHPPIYDLARRRLDLRKNARILCIGDGINTDIAGAMGEGLDSIFITGGLAHDQFGPDVETPNHAMLSDWLQARQKGPDFAMGRLR